MQWGEASFSAVLLGGYLGMLTLLWGAMTASIGVWHRRNALPAPAARPLPRLSICVPARDEAHQIAACVRGALAQDHADVEVIVVDDGSTDDTAAVARAAAPDDPRLRVVRNAPPPPGWAGKPWACQRAVAEASGAHLLFVDADVELAPDAARRVATVLLDRKLGMLSAFGTWRLESFWERVAIPVIGWFIRGATDVGAVNTPGRPEAFANGQFLLFDRATYESIGGHGAVRAEVLEDVRIARVAKQRGHPIGLYAAPDLFRVRLYRSLGEILRGYGKNLYEGMDRRPLLALGALLFLFIGSVAPWLFLAAVVVRPSIFLTGLEPFGFWAAWIALVCALPVLFRWRVERVDGRGGGYAWSHPLGNLVLAAVLLRAVFAVETTWKGRRFHDGKATG
jgi:glycosyltransferase involved in cell wall biosynthesis